MITERGSKKELNERSAMKKSAILLLFISLSCHVLIGQNRGVVFGTISDGQSKAPLRYASVIVQGSNQGTTSDLNGQYRLSNVPEGKQTLVFQYLGYPPVEKEVTVIAKESIELNVNISGEGLTLEEVTISVQAAGQQAAINRQINSNTIVNVVSQEKLRELPDQNAADAVGRLAGVSVQRDGGEGQQITIRGISPRFNAITVNGERLPSTEAENRSVDLSMISADALGGIELYKAIRPDMDGDAIGGAVNFTVRKADEYPAANLRILGGYNDLKSEFGQFRGVGTVSKRFFNNKLGIIASGNYQRVNRSNEFLDTSYEFLGTDPSTEEPVIKVATLNLGDRLEIRKRYGGSFTSDFVLGDNHSFLFNGTISQLQRDDQQFRRRYRVNNNEQRFTARERERSTFLLNGSLSGEHHWGNLSMNWRGSYASSNQQTPYALRGQFWELAAMNTGVENDRDLQNVPKAFKNDLNRMTMRDLTNTTSVVDESRRTAQVDLTYDFSIGKHLAGFVKTGAKYRSVSRFRDVSAEFMRPYLDGSENPAKVFKDLFVTVQSNQMLIANFLGEYNNDGFFDGLYDIHPGTAALRDTTVHSLEGENIAAINELFGTNYVPGDVLRYTGHIDHAKLAAFYNAYKEDFMSQDFRVDLEDYDGLENIYAAYAMTELNIGKYLMLMGGARFEDTRQEYSSKTGIPSPPDEGGSGYLDAIDVTASQGYSELLPMFHVRVKPAKWVDLRGAITKSLARPNFFNLVPWERINTDAQTINRGKPDLKHTTAWNYDAFLSFYNKFGLFTVGYFYKKLNNIDYVREYRIVDAGNRFNGYRLTEPDNIEGTSVVEGIELDLQGNLRSLNNFLRGIVVGANLTLAQSETFYPVFEVETEFIPTPPFFITTVLDTVRSGPLVGQADIIANFSLGYERKGFSGRISAIYQSRTLSPSGGVSFIPELDFYDDAFWRFDVAMKQKLDKKGRITAMLNISNLTNTPEKSSLGLVGLLRNEEYFGYMLELGLLFKFSKS